MKKIIFLGSGGGGNLKFIHHYSSDTDTFPFKVMGVFTDRACGAFNFGREINVNTEILSFNRNEEENLILVQKLRELEPDFIITNIHKIISKQVVQAFKGKLVNLHYSYLPAFGGLIGMEPVKQALARKNKFIGCTSHFVNQKVDDGETIAQGIFASERITDIYQSTFECGAITLLATLFQLCQGSDVLSHKFTKKYWISPFSSSINEDKVYSILENLKGQHQ